MAGGLILRPSGEFRRCIEGCDFLARGGCAVRLGPGQRCIENEFTRRDPSPNLDGVYVEVYDYLALTG